MVDEGIYQATMPGFREFTERDVYTATVLVINREKRIRKTWEILCLDKIQILPWKQHSEYLLK